MGSRIVQNSYLHRFHLSIYNIQNSGSLVSILGTYYWGVWYEARLVCTNVIGCLQDISARISMLLAIGLNCSGPDVFFSLSFWIDARPTHKPYHLFISTSWIVYMLSGIRLFCPSGVSTETSYCWWPPNLSWTLFTADIVKVRRA